MTRALFLKEYGNLENDIKKVYGIEMNEINNITDHNDALYRYKSELNMFRQIRNVLVHNATNQDFRYITVNNAMEVKMREVRKHILGKVREIGLMGDAVCRCQMGDKVIDAVQMMKVRDYSHVPVTDDEGRVFGVFSENTLLKIFADGKAKDILSDTPFEAISTYLAKPGDENLMFDFVRGDEFIHKCCEKFSIAHQKTNRLDILFITQDGTGYTPLEGLVTIWDLAGK